MKNKRPLCISCIYIMYKHELNVILLKEMKTCRKNNQKIAQVIPRIRASKKPQLACHPFSLVRFVSQPFCCLLNANYSRIHIYQFASTLASCAWKMKENNSIFLLYIWIGPCFFSIVLFALSSSGNSEIFLTEFILEEWKNFLNSLPLKHWWDAMQISWDTIPQIKKICTSFVTGQSCLLILHSQMKQW